MNPNVPLPDIVVTAAYPRSVSGGAGVAELRIRRFPERFEIWTTDDREAAAPELARTVERPYHWRGALDPISGECNDEYEVAGDRIAVANASGLEADMLGLVWAGYQGRTIALAIRGARDEGLEQLRAACGSLLHPDFLAGIGRILEAIYEVGSEESCLEEILMQWGTCPLDLPGLGAAVDEWCDDLAARFAAYHAYRAVRDGGDGRASG